MDAGDLAYLSLAEAADLVRTRAVSPVEIARVALERAERLQPHLDAFIRIDGDALLESARAAEAEIGRGTYRGPLHGLPVSLKDLFDVAGQPTTAGSSFLADRRPARDAVVWQRLRDAGALLVGKTNMHEFAFGSTGVNPHYGPARNPWNPERITGGSSSGSAAAVAAGIGYGTLGSDTGGSIRCPSALCGITGIKPTYGRVPRTGAFPLSWAQDHVGPMARTALDCAILLDAIAGPDPGDRTTLGVPPLQAAGALREGGDLRGLRVGVLTPHVDQVVDPGVSKAFDAAVLQLRDLGATISELDLPEEIAAMDAGTLILQSEASSIHLPWLRERPEAYGADVRVRLEAGALIPAVDYLTAERVRRKIVPTILGRLATVDVVVGPTVPFGAPPIGAPTVRFGDREVEPRGVLLRMTRIFDVTGQPAVSVPCGFTEEGLPVGLQVAGKPWAEGEVLRVAQCYQQATGWHTRRPPVD